MPPRVPGTGRFAAWAARRAATRATRPALSGAARDAIATEGTRTAAFTTKAAVGTVAVVGGAGAVRKVARVFKPEKTTMEDESRTTNEGTFVRGKDGDTTFVPSLNYLDALQRLNTGDGSVTDVPFVTFGPDESTKKTKAIADALTDPLTILAIGSIIMVALWMKSRKGGGGSA